MLHVAGSAQMPVLGHPRVELWNKGFARGVELGFARGVELGFVRKRVIFIGDGRSLLEKRWPALGGIF